MNKKRRWWLILGAAAYIGVLAYSIIDSLPFLTFSSGLIDTIDWITACTPYFFLGALIGYGVDRFLARNEKKSAPVPDFVWWTLALWIVGAILGNSLTTAPTTADRILYLFFPVIYGVFLTSFAWTAIAPSFVTTMYGKLALNICFLAVSGGWLYLELAQNKRTLFKRSLLVLIFLVFMLGTVSCARQLG